MNTRVRWTVLVGLLLLAGLLWWGSASDDAPPSDAPPTAATDAGETLTADAPGPRLQPTPMQQPRGPAAGGLCALSGRVLAEGRAVPATVYIKRLGDMDHGKVDPAAGAGGRVPPHLLEPPHWPKSDGLRTKDGRYTIRRLQSGVYRVFARTHDGRTGQAALRIPDGVLYSQLDVTVDGGANTLRGRAVYADGRPFAGWIEAGSRGGFDMFGGWDRFGLPVHTDADGRFELAGLPAGDVMLSAVVPGVMRFLDVSVRVPAEREYLLEIPDGSTRVTGRVIDARSGLGLPDATLTVSSGDAPGRGMMRRLTTSDDGAFEVTLLPTVHLLLAETKGYAVEQVFMRGQPTDSVVVAMKPEGSIHGRVVVKGTGDPAPGATVHAWWQGTRRAFSTHTVSGADGHYALTGVAPGTVLVVVGRGPWCSPGCADLEFAPPWTIELAPGADVQKDLEVDPAATIKGKVLAPDGEPVRGAAVKALGMFNAYTSTDQQGRFLLRGVAVGAPWTLRVDVPGHGPHLERRAAVSSGETELDIRLHPLRVLMVELLDADNGSAIANAKVRVRDKSAEGASATTDERGRCELTVSESALEVFVRPEAHLSPGKWLPVEGGNGPERRLSMVVRLKAGSTLKGVVVDEEGAPVPGALLTMEPAGTEYGEDWRRCHAYTDAEGRYLLQGLEETAHELTLSLPPDYLRPRPRQIAKEKREERIEVRRGTTILLRVEDEEGTPIPGARLNIWPAGESQALGGASDGLGVIRLRGIEPGVNHKLTLDPPGEANFARVNLRDWKPKAQTLRMVRSYEITGRVVDENGKPVAGAGLWYNPASPKSGATRIQTERDGRFRLRGLPKGKVLVLAEITPSDSNFIVSMPIWPDMLKDGVFETGKDLKVVEAGTKDVVLEVTRGASLSVRITEWKELRSSSPDVVLDGGTPDTRTEPEIRWDGTLTVRGLDATRTYTLWVGRLKNGHYIRESGLRPGTEVTVKATRGGVVTGRLLVPTGVAIEDCAVWLWGPYGHGIRGVIDADKGTYRVEGLPEGTFSLDASCEVDGERRYEARARVSAGDTADLELKRMP